MTLYPERGATILPREDYDCILHYAREARMALEYGPGVSTLALFEAGVPYVESFEHSPKWKGLAEQRYRPLVPDGCSWRLRYYSGRMLEIPKPYFRNTYDLGIVDGPQGGARWVGPAGYEQYSRYPTLHMALKHCRNVLLHDANRPGERRSLAKLGCTYKMLTEKMALCWL